MPEIKWTEDHSVGVAEIDAQHKELVKITNRLFLVIMNDSAFQVLLDILYELETYVEYHSFNMKRNCSKHMAILIKR